MVGLATTDPKEYQRQYRLANMDRIRARDHAYYLANRDKRRDQMREYRRSKGGGYLNGELDPKSPVGRGFISEIVVAKALGLESSARCNCTANFHFKYDLLDANKYGEINVKSSKLRADNTWGFTLHNKYTPDTYIFVAYSENYKNIEHVWVMSAYEATVLDKKRLKVHNSSKSLNRVREFEVDNTMYNVWLHTMSIDRCSVLKKPDILTEVIQ